MSEKIEIDAEVIDEVTRKAVEKLKGELTMPTADEIATKMAEKMEKTINKAADGEGAKQDEGEVSKEMHFARGLIANSRKDYAGISKYNAYSVKQWREKANYQNVTTAADGGALVPDPEFIAEVERLTDEYGVAARLATIRRTNNDSVTMLSGSNTATFTKVGEATAANSQKLTYAASTAVLDKYILTIPVTSELTEDAAIDIWSDVTNEVARARARLFDELVFTDATYGLLSAAVSDAYKTQTVGAAITDFTADDAMNAQYKVVASARKGARYFMHSTVWNALRQTKTGDGSNSAAAYLFGGPGQAVTPNIDGVPVELVDVLPEVGTITANTAFAVYGDLSRIKIHVKRLLETKIFDAGVVADAGGSDFNLITQDSYALRATLRCVPQTRFQGAFTIIGTGTVS